MCKLREVLMCNYHPNSRFNSHNRTIQAVTSQQRLPMQVHICKEGGQLFKSPVGWHKAVNTQWGIKTTIGETLLMRLTVASGLILIRYWLQPPSLTAIQSTCYNCTHREENNTMHTGNSKGQVLNKHTDLLSNINTDYQATAQILWI